MHGGAMVGSLPDVDSIGSNARIVDAPVGPWQRLWSVRWPSRFVAISLLIGFVMLFLTGQGRSIMAALTVDRIDGGQGGLVSSFLDVIDDRHVRWSSAGVSFWAFQSLHWSSVAIHFAKRRPDRRA